MYTDGEPAGDAKRALSAICSLRTGRGSSRARGASLRAARQNGELLKVYKDQLISTLIFWREAPAERSFLAAYLLREEGCGRTRRCCHEGDSSGSVAASLLSTLIGLPLRFRPPSDLDDHRGGGRDPCGLRSPPRALLRGIYPVVPHPVGQRPGRQTGEEGDEGIVTGRRPSPALFKFLRPRGHRSRKRAPFRMGPFWSLWG